MINELISNYQPDRDAVDGLKDAKITLLVGISGAGKDTIKKALLETGDFNDFISYTTRSPRINNGVAEKDGVDYHFIDHDQAINMLRKGEFIEAKLYSGNIYGTSFRGVASALDTGQVAVNDVEVQGVDEYKRLLPQTKAIFILPPSFDEWKRRLSNRYNSQDEFEEQWPKRREAAIRELSHALVVPYYHFVINDELNKAISVVGEIALGNDEFNRHDDEARLLARETLKSIEERA